MRLLNITEREHVGTFGWDGLTRNDDGPAPHVRCVGETFRGGRRCSFFILANISRRSLEECLAACVEHKADPFLPGTDTGIDTDTGMDTEGFSWRLDTGIDTEGFGWRLDSDPFLAAFKGGAFLAASLTSILTALVGVLTMMSLNSG